MAKYRPSQTDAPKHERPSAAGVLSKLLINHSKKGRRKPKMFPQDLDTAAQYWIAHQRAPDDYSEAMTEIRDNHEVIGYNAPYIDRLVRTLRQFLNLSDIHQAFVIDCIDRGMEYRGEDMRIYTEIAKQYEIMWKNPEAYKVGNDKILRRVRAGL